MPLNEQALALLESLPRDGESLFSGRRMGTHLTVTFRGIFLGPREIDFCFSYTSREGCSVSIATIATMGCKRQVFCSTMPAI